MEHSISSNTFHVEATTNAKQNLKNILSSGKPSWQDTCKYIYQLLRNSSKKHWRNMVYHIPLDKNKERGWELSSGDEHWTSRGWDGFLSLCSLISFILLVHRWHFLRRLEEASSYSRGWDGFLSESEEKGRRRD